jgi:hypothetical protein
MPPFKPMKRRDYERWIAQYGWSLLKAGMDWKLIDESGNLRVRNIIVTHPGGEVIPLSVKKTQKALEDAGL